MSFSSLSFPAWLSGAEWSHHGLYITLSYGISLFFFIFLTYQAHQRLKKIQQKLSQLSSQTAPASPSLKK